MGGCCVTAKGKEDVEEDMPVRYPSGSSLSRSKTVELAGKTELKEAAESGASRSDFFFLFQRGSNPKWTMERRTAAQMAAAAGHEELSAWLREIEKDFDSARQDLEEVLKGPSAEEDSRDWLERFNLVLDLVCCRYPYLVYTRDAINRVLALDLPAFARFEALYALKRSGVRDDPRPDAFVDLVFGREAIDPLDKEIWEDIGPIGSGGHSTVFLVKHKPTGTEWVRKGPIPDTFTGPDGTTQQGTPPEVLAKEECLAAELYQAFGAVMPLTRYGKTPEGQWYVLSQKFRDLGGRSIGKVVKMDQVWKPEVRAQQLFEGFVADCVVGNYDTVGFECDNMYITREGLTVRIDPGGALFYKSQGAKKSFEQFGKVDPPADKHDTELYQLKAYRTSTEYGDLGYAPLAMHNMRRVFAKFPEDEELILTYGAERCSSAQCEGAIEELCEAFYSGHPTLEQDQETLHRVLRYRVNWLRHEFLKERERKTYRELKTLAAAGNLRIGVASAREGSKDVNAAVAPDPNGEESESEEEDDNEDGEEEEEDEGEEEEEKKEEEQRQQQPRQRQQQQKEEEQQQQQEEPGQEEAAAAAAAASPEGAAPQQQEEGEEPPQGPSQQPLQQEEEEEEPPRPEQEEEEAAGGERRREREDAAAEEEEEDGGQGVQGVQEGPAAAKEAENPKASGGAKDEKKEEKKEEEGQA